MGDMTHEDVRNASLARFSTALRDALNRMPVGYPGATEDRNRFCAPVEQVIQELETLVCSDESPSDDDYRLHPSPLPEDE